MTWVLAAAAALIVGVSKTSFGGLGSVAVALLAFTLPTKESTAAALLMLITGDIMGVLRYRTNADWRLLKGLLPSVVPGILLGTGFLYVVDDLFLRRSIGVILLISVVMQLVATLRGKIEKSDDAEPPSRVFTVGAGVAAGFTSMAANAAGPVMALYLQLSRVTKMRFLGTSAWFYLFINLGKTPFTAALGLFTPQVLQTYIYLAPLVLLGGVIGVVVIRHVNQKVFDVITLVTSMMAAGALLVF